VSISWHVSSTHTRISPTARPFIPPCRSQRATHVPCPEEDFLRHAQRPTETRSRSIDRALHAVHRCRLRRSGALQPRHRHVKVVATCAQAPRVSAARSRQPPRERQAASVHQRGYHKPALRREAGGRPPASVPPGARALAPHAIHAPTSASEAPGGAQRYTSAARRHPPAPSAPSAAPGAAQSAAPASRAPSQPSCSGPSRVIRRAPPGRAPPAFGGGGGEVDPRGRVACFLPVRKVPAHSLHAPRGGDGSLTLRRRAASADDEPRIRPGGGPDTIEEVCPRVHDLGPAVSCEP
jgi:hypothetical protein